MFERLLRLFVDLAFLHLPDGEAISNSPAYVLQNSKEYQMYSKFIRTIQIAIILVLGICAEAHSDIVSIELSGTIKTFFYVPFDSSVQIGTSYSASFYIDTNAHYTPGSSPTGFQFMYDETSVMRGMTLSFGDYKIHPVDPSGTYNELAGSVNGQVLMTPGPNRPDDNLYLRSYYEGGSGLINAYSLVTLYSTPNTALTMPGLPPSGPGMNDIRQWNYSTEFYFDAMGVDGNRHIWDGNVTSISTTVTSVPEPGVLMLLASATVGTFLLARRRRTKNNTLSYL